MYNVNRLTALMVESGIDALIATTRENVLYLSGFDPVIKTLNPYHGHCYVVVSRSDTQLVHVVHSRGEVDQVLDAKVPVGEVAVYGTFFRENNWLTELTAEEQRLCDLTDDSNAWASPSLALKALLARLDLLQATVGIDEDGISAVALAELGALIPRVSFLPASKLLRATRSVKTATEVERLRYSARCIENAISKASESLYEGINEDELARNFEIALVQQRARPSLTMLKFGRHAVGGQRRQQHDITLQVGDIVWFDCDAICDGYWADIARVFSYGKMTSGYHKFRALHEGQKIAMEKVRPGMTGGQVFDLTMSVVHASGFPEYRRHHVGHGIGLEPYERPFLAPGNTDVIEVGMVLSLETPYYEFGIGALHVEDPILVGECGNERLTVTSGELGIIDAI